MATEPPASHPTRVAVCICTYRRPDVLRGLLTTIAEQANEAAPAVEVTVAIVDDDPAGSAEPIAEASAAAFDGRLVYRCTGSGNVAAARNQALELGLDAGELLLMIDDDCRPDTGWIAEIVAVQMRTGADLVAGACDTELPDGSPGWLRDEPFTDGRSAGIDGADVEDGYLKNLLVSAAFIRENDLRFDLRFGRSGGEDAMFLVQAKAHGGRMVHSAHAVVRERLPEERTSLGYQLRRRAWYGNTEALTSIASGSTSRQRMAAGGIKLALLGIVRPVGRLLRRESAQLRFAISEVLRGGGRVLGAMGVRLDHK